MATWAFENLVNPVGVDDLGDNCTCAVDSSGTLHVVGYDFTNDAIVYKSGSSDWETVSTGLTIYYCALAIGSDDSVHIIFQRRPTSATTKKLTYAYKSGESWVLEDIATGTITTLSSYISHGSLTVDSSNVPHVTYIAANGKNVSYSSRTGGTWSAPDVVATSASDFGTAVISTDSNNAPHISYQHGVDGTKYATKETGSWVISTIDASVVGYNIALDIDTNNNSHVAYSKYSTEDLYYCKRTDGTWGSPETINDTANVTDNNVALSLQVAADGNPWIQYNNNVAPDYPVAFARFDGEAWNLENITTDANNNGLSSRMVVDDYTPYVVFYYHDADLDVDCIRVATTTDFVPVEEPILPPAYPSPTPTTSDYPPPTTGWIRTKTVEFGTTGHGYEKMFLFGDLLLKELGVLTLNQLWRDRNTSDFTRD